MMPEIVPDHPHRVRRLLSRATAWRHGWLQLGGLASLSVGFGAVHYWLGLVTAGIGLILFGVAQELGQS